MRCSTRASAAPAPSHEDPRAPCCAPARAPSGLRCWRCWRIAALAAPLLYPGDPLAIVGAPLVRPFTDAAHPLGTDRLGRDVAAELVYGTRTSLLVAIAAAATALGDRHAGRHARGLSRRHRRRGADAHHRGVPDGARLPAGARLRQRHGADRGRRIVIAIAIGAWTQPARIARAEVLSLRERDFVAAARVIGMRPVEIAFREILPNALTPIVSLAAVIVAAAVLIEAALSFLGFGDPEPRDLGLHDRGGPHRAARRALPLHRARRRAGGDGARRPPDRPRLHDRHRRQAMQA